MSVKKKISKENNLVTYQKDDTNNVPFCKIVKYLGIRITPQPYLFRLTKNSLLNLYRSSQTGLPGTFTHFRH